MAVLELDDERSFSADRYRVIGGPFRVIELQPGWCEPALSLPQFLDRRDNRTLHAQSVITARIEDVRVSAPPPFHRHRASSVRERCIRGRDGPLVAGRGGAGGRRDAGP